MGFFDRLSRWLQGKNTREQGGGRLTRDTSGVFSAPRHAQGREKHDMIFLPCTAFPAFLPGGSCQQVIGIAVDIGPSVWRCPICSTVYVVHSLKQHLAFDRMDARFRPDGRWGEQHDKDSFLTYRSTTLDSIDDQGLWEAFLRYHTGSAKGVFVAEPIGPADAIFGSLHQS